MSKKNPTVKQKKLLESAGYEAEDYLVHKVYMIKECDIVLFVHRRTGQELRLQSKK